MRIKSILIKVIAFYIIAQSANIAFAQTPILPTASDFGSLGTREIDISDDGSAIIFITGEDNDANVRVVDLNDFSVRAIRFKPYEKVRNAFWVNDMFIVAMVYTTENDGFTGFEIEVPHAYIFAKKGVYAQEILQHRPYTNIRYLNGKFESPFYILVESSFQDNQAIIDLPQDQRSRFDKIVRVIYKVDVRTGEGEELEYGSPETYSWGITQDAKIVARIDYSNYYNRNRIFHKVGKEWKKVYEYIPENAEDDFNWNGLLDEKTGLFVLTEKKVTTAYKIDLDTGKIEKFISEPDKIIDSIKTERNSKKPIIVNYSNIYPDYKWLDKEIEGIQQKLDATYPTDYVDILDWTLDRKKYVFSLKSESVPERYFIYNIEKKKINGASSIAESFKHFKFAKKELEVFDARDKQEVPVFVTFPNKEKLEKLPTIVLPHGGPHAHDDIYYDYLSQFLASRGYLVIQPQFRGSSGFGNQYAELGKKQWGGIMQNDVTDSLKWAIDKGWADKDRACIIGASYGGYAALAGVTMTPELYKCAVSGAGVSDLNLMLKSEIKSNGKNSQETEYWKDHIGFDKYTKEEIAARSPINLVDKIKVPVLLIHGDDDSVVLPEQSKNMEAAMKKAGKEVRYVVLKNEDHWLSRHETRTQFLTEIENFLKPILKPEE